MQEKVVNVNDQNIAVKEFKGRQGVTFKDIDRVHERVEGIARRNFNTNKQHFIEGDDYFFVKSQDIQKYEIRTTEINNAGTYLIMLSLAISC